MVKSKGFLGFKMFLRIFSVFFLHIVQCSYQLTKQSTPLMWEDPIQKNQQLYCHISMLMHFLVEYKQYTYFLLYRQANHDVSFEINKREVLNYISK